MAAAATQSEFAHTPGRSAALGVALHRRLISSRATRAVADCAMARERRAMLALRRWVAKLGEPTPQLMYRQV